MDSNVIEGQFSVEDEETVAPPSYHTILEVWRSVLSNVHEERKLKVGTQWANRLVTSYPEVRYADLNWLRDSFFDKITELLGLLDEEIAKDGDCLTYDNPDDDRDENGGHYRKLLSAWQLAVQGWGLDWDCEDPHAGAEIAAIAEVHKMFFGGPNAPGLTQYLDNIQLEFTEADQQELAAALDAQVESHREGAQ